MFDLSKDNEAQVANSDLFTSQQLAVERVIMLSPLKHYSIRSTKLWHLGKTTEKRQYGHSVSIQWKLADNSCIESVKLLEHEILKRKRIELTAGSLRYELKTTQKVQSKVIVSLKRR